MEAFDKTCPRCEKRVDEEAEIKKTKKYLQDKIESHEKWVLYIMQNTECSRIRAEEALQLCGYNNSVLDYIMRPYAFHGGKRAYGTCPYCGGNVLYDFVKKGQSIDIWIIILLTLLFFPCIFLLCFNKPDTTHRTCRQCGQIWQIF
jgi:sarcosine oxidase delta subunit